MPKTTRIQVKSGVEEAREALRQRAKDVRALRSPQELAEILALLLRALGLEEDAR